MQKKESISEVARKIVDLRKQFDTVTELKEKAFTPCNPNSYYELDELHNALIAWSELFSWTRHSANHYGTLIIKDYTDLAARFNLLTRAIINREEFCNSPVVIEACKAVEKYIDELDKEILSQLKRLDSLYDQFANDAGQYAFIFKETEIKRIIINELLFS